jgi:hypothetical protein
MNWLKGVACVLSPAKARECWMIAGRPLTRVRPVTDDPVSTAAGDRADVGRTIAGTPKKGT